MTAQADCTGAEVDDAADWCEGLLPVVWDATTDAAVVAEGFCAVADVWGADHGSPPGPSNPLDGAPEVVFATYSTEPDFGELFVLDGGGNLLHRLPLPDRGAMPVPTIADADGDGTLDIVVSLKDAQDDGAGAQVLVYRVDGSSENCLLWATGRGNYYRDGYVPAE